MLHFAWRTAQYYSLLANTGRVFLNGGSQLPAKSTVTRLVDEAENLLKLKSYIIQHTVYMYHTSIVFKLYMCAHCLVAQQSQTYPLITLNSPVSYTVPLC
jgi:hypothetical protein